MTEQSTYIDLSSKSEQISLAENLQTVHLAMLRPEQFDPFTFATRSFCY